MDRLRRRLRLLSNAVEAFAEATADLDRLLVLVAQSVGQALDCITSVRLCGDDGVLREVAHWTPDPATKPLVEGFAPTPIRPGDPSTVWKVMATGEPLHVPALDLAAFEGKVLDSGLRFLRDLDVRTLIVAPMRVQAKPVGTISFLGTGAREAFDELDLELARDLANHAALALANSRLVTALRDSEALIEAQQEALRANRFLDAIVEHMPSMLFVKDAQELRFTHFNRTGEALLGVTRDQILGKTDYDLFPPEEAAFFQEKDRETLAGDKIVRIQEEPVQTRDGVRWLFTKKVPIRDEDGTPTHLLGISYDITERKLADAALRDAKDRAEAASRELEAFSYSVAHDLRAPLRGIDGFSQALAEDYGAVLDDTGKRYLGRIRDGAQRMAVLIDDLLALSRVTRAELALQRVDLTALAHATAARLQRSEPTREAAIEIAPDLTAHADPRLLAIALENLFSNAWKFTSKTPHARIELVAEGGAFVVRDNGAGFDMKYEKKLFGVFQRLHTEAEFPGTGIGLATVARIIHRHRGRVWATGAVGQGAAFHFTLGDPEDR